MSCTWDVSGVQVKGPSWTEMVDEAARQLGFPRPELLRVRGNDLQILEYFSLKNSRRLDSLKSWLVSQLNAPDAAIRASPIHSSLARLARCNLFYTTNYDNFIERALVLAG